jgi:hypothetical protein
VLFSGRVATLSFVSWVGAGAVWLVGAEGGVGVVVSGWVGTEAGGDAITFSVVLEDFLKRPNKFIFKFLIF